jgi:hypothetical protein
MKDLSGNLFGTTENRGSVLRFFARCSDHGRAGLFLRRPAELVNEAFDALDRHEPRRSANFLFQILKTIARKVQPANPADRFN